MNKKGYTLMIIPDKETKKIKNITLSPRVLSVIKIGGATFVFFLLISCFAFYQAFNYKYDYDRVNTENRHLRDNVAAIEYQLKSIEKSFDTINEFSKKVRMLTELDSNSKELMAIGPITEEDEALFLEQKKNFN